MDIADASDMRERHPLDIVKREQQAVGRGQSRKCLGNRFDKLREKPRAIWVHIFNGDRALDADPAAGRFIVEWL